MRRSSTLTALGLASLLLLQACSNKKPPYDPNRERRFFGVAFRQLPPDPVYNRLKLARLPEPLPPTDLPRATGNAITPVFHLELTKTSLEQTARILANLARYTSYTSSVIASRKVDLEGLGTIDELADQISESAGINVVVDHDNREVRFLANGTPRNTGAPRASAPRVSAPAPAAGGRVAGATRAGRQFETNTVNGIAASPLSPDKFSDETLERLTGTR